MTTAADSGTQSTAHTGTQPVIEVRGLVKRYDSITAVNGIDLTVYPSEIFGIVGPNGAGKTTTLEMIEGLREPDEGTIQVAGLDARREPEAVKRRIGIQLQTTALFDHLTVREIVRLFGSLYGFPMTDDWVDHVIQQVSLEEKASVYADTLSGGQQQRLSIALALANDPEIVFLDEPTTGLDPQARRNLWGVVEEIRAAGKTVVLTTHYMEEAEILCDRVAIMDRGEIIRCDTPRRLIGSLEADGSISVDFGGQMPPEHELAMLTGATGVHADNGTVTISTSSLQSTMIELVELSHKRGFSLGDLSTSRPTLEDVFLHYTGRTLRE